MTPSLLLEISARVRRAAPALLVLVFELACVPPAFAGTLLISVGASTEKGVPECGRATAKPRHCSTSFEEVVRKIADERWIAGLSDQITKVHIRLAPGVYRVFKPIRIEWNNKAARGKVLVIEGGGIDATIVSGGVPLSAWYPVNSSRLDRRINRKHYDKVHVADLSHLPLPFAEAPKARGFGLKPSAVLGELFYRTSPLPIAGWPNDGFAIIDKTSTSTRSGLQSFTSVMSLNEGLVEEEDLLAHGFWRHNWAAQAYPARAATGASQTLILAEPGSPYGLATGQRFRVENALSELDADGEWYIDRKARRIYLYRHSGIMPTDSFELSIAETLLEVDYAEDVTIKDLSLVIARGDGVRVRNSRRINIQGVRIASVANRGVQILDSSESGLRDSVVEDTGEGGVFLSGGDRITLTPSGNYLRNSIVRRFSRRVFTLGVGAELRGVGNLVEGTVFSESPHTAIMFYGNDHRISDNTFYDVVRLTSDAGVIYTGRDFTAQGTVISGNFFRDIQPFERGKEVKGIYLDDQASGTTIMGNLFARVQQPVFIGGGRQNKVLENIFYRSSPSIHIDARGREGQLSQTQDPRGELQRRLDAVPIASATYRSRYPLLAGIRQDDFGLPKYNIVRNNWFIDSVGTRISQAARFGVEIDGNQELAESDLEKLPNDQTRMSRNHFQIGKRR